MTTLESIRQSFYQNVKTLEEMTLHWEKNALKKIEDIHNSNNKRIRAVMDMLNQDAKYLWRYCKSTHKWVENALVGTLSFNIAYKGEYANLVLSLVYLTKEQRYLVNCPSIIHQNSEYKFAEREFFSTDNLLDYAELIEDKSKWIDRLEQGMEEVYKFLYRETTKEVEEFKKHL